MTAYMMVYLVSPFIEKGLDSLSKGTVISVMVGMGIIEFFSLPVNANLGSSFFGLLFIYILARYMRKAEIHISMRKALVLLATAICLIIIVEEFINSFISKKELMFWCLQFNNPIIIVEAVSLFYIVKDLPVRQIKWINLLLAPCLCVYLVPEQILPYKKIVSVLEESTITGTLYIFLFIFGSLAFGHVAFFVSKKIMGMIPVKE